MGSAGSRVSPGMGVPREPEVVSLREQVARLAADNAHLTARVRELLALVGELRGTIARQQDHIDRLVKMTFGRKSERVEGPTLFDDLPDPPPDVTADPEPEAPGARRKGHGRRPNPADLPRRREVIDLGDAEKPCPCCATVRVRIGEAIRERLDYTPASIFVRELAVQTYVCRRCERAAENPRFASPAVPSEPVPGSGVGAGLLARVVVSNVRRSPAAVPSGVDPRPARLAGVPHPPVRPVGGVCDPVGAGLPGHGGATEGVVRDPRRRDPGPTPAAQADGLRLGVPRRCL